MAIKQSYFNLDIYWSSHIFSGVRSVGK